MLITWTVPATCESCGASNASSAAASGGTASAAGRRTSLLRTTVPTASLCTAPAVDVVVEDSDGNVVFSGRDALHDHYAKLFKAAPDLQAEVVARIRVGSFTIDEQLVTGGPRGDIPSAAVYRVNSDGLIDRVQFLS